MTQSTADGAKRPYRRLSPLTPVVRSFIFVVAAAATAWRELLGRDVGPLGWILLGLLVAGLVYGGLSWLRTKYWIEADELRVDTGLVSRQSRRLRIDRLQGVDIAQPFVARLFGLAELKMDVAGGSAREGSLAFLRLSDAQALKDLLLARRDEVREAGMVSRSQGQPVSGTAGGARSEAEIEAGIEAGTETRVGSGTESRVDARIDARVGSGAGVASGVVAEQVLARVAPMMLLASLALSLEMVALILSSVATVVLVILTGEWTGIPALLPVLGGFALVIFRRFVGYYNFTVSQTAAGLQVRRGLFDLSSQTIALSRVQGVVISETALWRRMGWARLDVAVAGYAGGDESKPSASTILPVGTREDVLRMARHLLQGLDPESVLLTAPPDRSKWVAPFRRLFMAAGIGDDLIVSKGGWLNRRTHMVPHARVQSLRLSQGPWQRHLGLTDLHVDSPPGAVKVRVRHRLTPEARRLLEQEAGRGRQERLRAGRQA